MNFKKILSSLFISFLLVFLFISINFFNIKATFLLKVIFFAIAIILMFGSTFFKYLNKIKLSRFLFLLFVLYSVFLIIYNILIYTGIFDTFSSPTAFKKYILSTKEKGVFIYIAIQIAQVIFLPIPAAIICIVGSLIYGPFLGALYCTIGILIGSYISYSIGKIFGQKVVSWVVGAENTQKYSSIIASRGRVFLCLAFLLPMFPDDILCLIAGITSMSFVSFFWVTLITRPIGVICMSYFGSGNIIPFSGWGIYVWGIILVIAIIIAITISKYQDKIQNFILCKIFKKKV